VVRSAVVYRLGGRQYPMMTASQCLTCNSPYRVEIERALIRSYSAASIHRSLPAAGQSALSVHNILEHARKHLPVDHSIRQAAIEARSRELGIDVASAEGALVDHISFARLGLQQVYEAMVEGKVHPDVKDGIAFANVLLKVEERSGGGMDEEMMARGFLAYMSALRQVCTPGQIQSMNDLIQADPIMKSLLGRSERVIEVGVVDPEAVVA